MNTTQVTTQPAERIMNFGDEKHPAVNSTCESSDLHPHRTCHKSRRRRLLIHALLTLLALASMIAISCLSDIQALNIFSSEDGFQGMGKRAIGDSRGSNSGNTLVDKKCKLPLGYEFWMLTSDHRLPHNRLCRARACVDSSPVSRCLVLQRSVFHNDHLSHIFFFPDMVYAQQAHSRTLSAVHAISVHAAVVLVSLMCVSVHYPLTLHRWYLACLECIGCGLCAEGIENV